MRNFTEFLWPLLLYIFLGDSYNDNEDELNNDKIIITSMIKEIVIKS